MIPDQIRLVLLVLVGKFVFTDCTLHTKPFTHRTGQTDNKQQDNWWQEPGEQGQVLFQRSLLFRTSVAAGTRLFLKWALLNLRVLYLRPEGRRLMYLLSGWMVSLTRELAMCVMDLLFRETNDFSSGICDACEFSLVCGREHSKETCRTVQKDGLDDTLI